MTCHSRRAASLGVLGFSLAFTVSVVSCARTGLYPGELEGDESFGGGAAPSSAGHRNQAGSAPDTSGYAGGGGSGSGGARSVGDAPTCSPRAETCNGMDDDCNSAVDDVEPSPCPGGGARYCVAGRLSECPKRCEVCVPGSVRICQNPFCTFWGEQECAADGQGFGNCREANPPPECASVAKRHQNSRELEQCCLDNGYCCVDEHDLDGDGIRREMLGACGDVSCR